MRVHRSGSHVSRRKLLRFNSESSRSLSDSQEEPTLESIYGWPTHRRAVRFTDCYLKLFGLTFDQVEGRKWHCKNHRSTLSRLSSYCVIAYCIYIPIKFGAIAWLQFSHDSLLKRWQPQVRAGSMRLNKCVLQEDLIADTTNNEVLAQVYEIENWLSWLGHVCTSTTGLASMEFNLIVALGTFYTLASYYYLRFRPVRVDFLCFIRDKLSQRANMRRKQSILAATLIKCAQSYRRSLASRSWFVSSLESKEQVRFSRDGDKEGEQELKFTQLLWSVCSRKLEEPANLTDMWHRRITRLYHNWHVGFYLGCFIFSIVVTVTFLLSELLMRTAHRLDQITCQQWHPNGTLIDWPSIRLAHLSVQATDAYKELARERNNATMLTLLSFGLRYEMPLTFDSVNSRFCLSELFFAVNFQGISLCFCQGIMLLGMLDELAWISQVGDQLKKTNELLRINRQKTSALDRADIHNCETEFAAIGSAIISYINYTLLKNHYSNFKSIIERLIEQNICLLGQAMIVCYYVSTHTNSRMVWFVFCTLAYLLIVVNYRLIIGSYMYVKLTRIMRDIMAMVAQLRELSTDNMDYISNIWQRQLLDNNEMREIFSFKSFGATVSYDKVVLVNAYMLALWIIMFNSS